MVFAPDAVVWWQSGRPDVRNWARYFRYARGDAHAGMYPERHALRFAAYTALALALRSRRRWPKVMAAAGAIAYARAPVRRAWRRLGKDPLARATAVLVVPAILGFLDSAKTTGYVAGLIDRAKRTR